MDKEIKLRSSEIAYKVHGNGQPVLLLHGFAEDGEIWKYQVEFLKDKFKLIVPDIPGSGRSPFNKAFVTIDDFAEIINPILDHEKINHMALIGHSMGGYISMAFAEKYPERLAGLGLFHSTAYPDTEEKKLARRKSIEFIKEHGAADFIRTTIPNLFAQSFCESHPEQIRELIETYSTLPPEALIQYYEAMILRPDRTSILKHFQKPVLFIMGEEDKAVPFQDSLKQAHLPSISFIHILQKNGHMGMIENPEKCNSYLVEFLQNSLLRPPGD